MGAKLDKLASMFEPACILVDKVYDQCLDEACIPEIIIELNGENYDGKISFSPGFIVPETLVVSKFDNLSGENFKRIQFIAKIPFNISTNQGMIHDYLPDITKDIILFIPEAREEFDYRIIIETQTVVIPKSEKIEEEALIFAAAYRLVVKVVGRVQLMVAQMGTSPLPNKCTEYMEPTSRKYEDFQKYFEAFFPETGE